MFRKTLTARQMIILWRHYGALFTVWGDAKDEYSPAPKVRFIDRDGLIYYCYKQENAFPTSRSCFSYDHQKDAGIEAMYRYERARKLQEVWVGNQKIWGCRRGLIGKHKQIAKVYNWYS